MNITIQQVQGRVPVTILQTHGDLDYTMYKDLIARAKEVYEAGARDILLDLSDTPFMGSSGLVALHSIILMLRGEAPPDPGSGWSTFHTVTGDVERKIGFEEHFKLLSPQPAVDQALEMTGFKTFLHIFTDLETAIASF